MRGLVVGIVVLALLVAAPAAFAAPTAPDPAAGTLTFARDLELRTQEHPTIGDVKVVHSIEVPGLDASELIRVRAEVEITTCEKSSDWKCGKTGLQPRIFARIVLADGNDATDGLELDADEVKCKRHHCPLVLSAEVNPTQAASHVNLVLGSSLAGAGNNDSIEIKAPKSHNGGGHLAVLRSGAGYNSRAEPASDDKKNVDALPIQTGEGNPPPKKKVVFSVKLENLDKGDVLDVRGALEVQMDARVRSNAVPAVVGSQIFLAGSRHQTEVDDIPTWRRIALNTGFNCGRSCPVTKVGAIKLEEKVGKTLYVNYVALSSRTTPGADDACHGDCKAKVVGGGLTVRRLPETTPVPPPQAVTNDPSNAKCRTATFNGLVDAHGTETRFRFVWRRTEGDEQHETPWRPAGSGEGGIPVTEDVDGLVRDREYEVRLVAQNAGGRAEGRWRRFRSRCPDTRL